MISIKKAYSSIPVAVKNLGAQGYVERQRLLIFSTATAPFTVVVLLLMIAQRYLLNILQISQLKIDLAVVNIDSRDKHFKCVAESVYLPGVFSTQ